MILPPPSPRPLRQRFLATVARARALLLIALALCSPGTLLAKAGDGIGIGEGRLKLGAELGGVYDSKVGRGYFSGRRIPDPPDAIVQVAGLADLLLPGPGYELDFDARLTWNQYLGVYVNTRPLSYFGADLRGGAVFRKGAPLSFEVGSSLSHSDRSATPVFGIGVLALHNQNYARLRARPGQGALEILGAYELGLDLFSPQIEPAKGMSSGICDEIFECNPDLAASFNSLTHRLGTEIRWKLFPRTGFFLAGDVGVRHYISGDGKQARNVGALPVRAFLGAATSFTPRLDLSLRGGWTGLFFSDQQAALHTWLGQGELSWRWSKIFQSRLGYQHNVEPTGGSAAFYALDRGYVELSATFYRFTFSLTGLGDWVDFGRLDRQDLNLGATLKADFRIAPWIKLVAGAGAYRRISEGDTATTGAFSYNREEASLGVNLLF